MEATEEVVLVVDASRADLIEYLEGGFEEKLDGVLLTKAHTKLTKLSEYVLMER
jgi:hypothetical protein